MPMENLTEIMGRLEKVIRERRFASTPDDSYVAKMTRQGRAKMAQKIGEEGVELTIAAVRDKHDEIIKESADLLFHMLLLWVDAGISPSQVAEELRRREGVSGLEEKKSRPIS